MIIDQQMISYKSQMGLDARVTSGDVLPVEVWQTFTPSLNGILTGADLVLTGKYSGHVEFRVYDGSDTTGALIYKYDTNISVNYFSYPPDYLLPSIDNGLHFPLNIQVMSGHIYTISLVHDQLNIGESLSIAASTVDSYFGGNSGTTFLGTVSAHENDLAFRTYLEPFPSLFDNYSNSVDFNKQDPSDYNGPFTDSKDGNDVVTLPNTTDGIVVWGLDSGFHGGAGGDTITGGKVGIAIYGDGGFDKLYGGTGADTIFGGIGNDTLYASPQGVDDHKIDVLYGGTNDADIFYVGDGDFVMDIEVGEELIINKPDNFNYFGVTDQSDLITNPGKYLYSIGMYHTVNGQAEIISNSNVMSNVPLSFIIQDIGNSISAKVSISIPYPPPLPIIDLPPIPDPDKDFQDLINATVHIINTLGASRKYSDSVNFAVQEIGSLLKKYATDDVKILKYAEKFDAVIENVSRSFGPVGNLFQAGGVLFETVKDDDHARGFVVGIVDLLTQRIIQALGTFSGAIFGTLFFGTGLVPGAYIGGLTANAIYTIWFETDTKKYIAKHYTDLFGEHNSQFNTIHGNTGSAIDGTDNNDICIADPGGSVIKSSAGINIYLGGIGIDTIDYSNSPTKISADLAIGEGGYEFNITTSRAYSPSGLAAPNTTSIVTNVSAVDFYVAIDNVVGSPFDDTIVGSVSANHLNGGAGSDILDGGAGNDIAIYSVARGAATVTRNPVSRALTVNAGADGVDTLNHVEQLQFSDGLFSYQFAQPGAVVVANFAVGAGGWSSQTAYPRHIADVNGDGYADIVGFGQAGVLVSFGSASGTFSSLSLAIGNFGQASGWSSDNLFHRELADVNGDGRADVIGFGQAGTLVSLANADRTFSAPTLGVANFGAAQGWSTQDGYERTVGDINGDGKADIIGFGQLGTLVALGNGDGTFKPVTFGVANFGVAQGWSSDTSFHRAVADVNGDGRADIVGFGVAGTYVALSNGDGTFGAANLVLNNFGANQGWTSNDSYPRLVADVNHDGFADIVGFGAAGTFVAFGNGDGSFTGAGFDVANFSKAQGWSSDATYHRELADINHDGLLDIVGFGQAGVLVGLNQGDVPTSSSASQAVLTAALARANSPSDAIAVATDPAGASGGDTPFTAQPPTALAFTQAMAGLRSEHLTASWLAAGGVRTGDFSGALAMPA